MIQNIFSLKTEILEPGIVGYSCNPSTHEAEAGRSQVQDQPELHRKFKASL
jgi:hypothetical protein